MTEIIFCGTPKRARTVQRRVRSTESYALVRLMKHTYDGICFFRANSRSLKWAHSNPTIFIPIPGLILDGNWPPIRIKNLVGIVEREIGILRQGFLRLRCHLSRPNIPVLVLQLYAPVTAVAAFRKREPPNEDSDGIEEDGRIVPKRSNTIALLLLTNVSTDTVFMKV